MLYAIQRYARRHNPVAVVQEALDSCGSFRIFWGIDLWRRRLTVDQPSIRNPADESLLSRLCIVRKVCVRQERKRLLPGKNSVDAFVGLKGCRTGGSGVTR